MKLIIDIPEDVYKRTKFYKEFRDLNDCVTTIKALENGTPLDEVITDRVEYGADGNAYRLTISNGKALEQEPKTGHWIDMDEGFSPCECSECGAVEFNKSKYCPNCGAKMNGKENEQ